MTKLWCKIFNHRLRFLQYIWPNEPAWCVYCTRCDERFTRLIPGHRTDGL